MFTFPFLLTMNGQQKVECSGVTLTCTAFSCPDKLSWVPSPRRRYVLVDDLCNELVKESYRMFTFQQTKISLLVIAVESEDNE